MNEPDLDVSRTSRRYTGSHDKEGASAIEKQTFAAQAEIASTEKFLLERQGARMRDELARKKFTVASLSTQVQELTDEVRRWEKETKCKDTMLEGCAQRLHEQEVALSRARREKTETDEMLEATAESLRETRARLEQLEGRGLWEPVGKAMDGGLVGEARGAPTATGEVPSKRTGMARIYALSLACVAILAMGVFAGASLDVVSLEGITPLGTTCRRSALLVLRPGGPSLAMREYISSCRTSQWLTTSGGTETSLGGCQNPHFLWLQGDGNLILYRGTSPSRHAGPVWATQRIEGKRALGLEGESLGNARGKKGSRDGGRQEERPRYSYRAFVDGKKRLKVVRRLEGSADEKTVFSMAAKRLPKVLFPWPFLKD